MHVDPRIQELLERYPDQLTEDELSELRAAGEADPAVEGLMDAIHEAEAVLEGRSETRLSKGGEARLEALLQGAEASESEPRQQPGSGDDVVDLAVARARRAPPPAAWLLAAAALLVIGFWLGPWSKPSSDGPGSTFGPKGEVEAPRGELFVRGEERISDGESRSIDRAVTFRAVMGAPAALVLLETQGGRTFVIHPAPGASWEALAGSNLVQPAGGSASYRPAAPGTAVYTLVGSRVDRPIPVPAGAEVESVESLLQAADSGAVIDRIELRWEAAP